jgi:hypothetical protein
LSSSALNSGFDDRPVPSRPSESSDMLRLLTRYSDECRSIQFRVSRNAWPARHDAAFEICDGR